MLRSARWLVAFVVLVLGGCALLRPLRPLEPKRLDPWPVQTGKALVYGPAAVGLLAIEAAAMCAGVGVAIVLMAGGQHARNVAASDELHGGAAPMETRSPVW